MVEHEDMSAFDSITRVGRVFEDELLNETVSKTSDGDRALVKPIVDQGQVACGHSYTRTPGRML